MGTKYKLSRNILKDALNGLKRKARDIRDRIVNVSCYDPMDPVKIDGETVFWSCEDYENHGRSEPRPQIIVTLREYKSITEEICKINRLGYDMDIQYYMDIQYLCGDCIKSIIKSRSTGISEAAKNYFDKVADKNSLFTIFYGKRGEEKSYLSLHPVIDKRQVLLSDLKNLYDFLKEWEKHEYTLLEDIKDSGKFDFEAIEYLTGIKVE